MPPPSVIGAEKRAWGGSCLRRGKLSVKPRLPIGFLRVVVFYDLSFQDMPRQSSSPRCPGSRGQDPGYKVCAVKMQDWLIDRSRRFLCITSFLTVTTGEPPLRRDPLKDSLWIPSGKTRSRAPTYTPFLGIWEQKRRPTSPYLSGALINGSIEAAPDFWARLWEFAGIKASRGYDQVVDDARKMPGATNGFPAEAELCRKSPAVSRTTARPYLPRRKPEKTQMTYAELYAAVARLAQALPGGRFGAQPGTGCRLYAEHDGNSHCHGWGDLPSEPSGLPAPPISAPKRPWDRLGTD